MKNTTLETMPPPDYQPFTPDTWVEQAWVPAYPLFAKRARRFAIRLRRELADMSMPARLILQRAPELPVHQIRLAPQSLSLFVIADSPTPGYGTGLRVWVAMHSNESRRHFGIDYDYGLNHCQYIATLSGSKIHDPYFNDYMRWCRARDAINGIKEWVMSHLYIPGI